MFGRNPAQSHSLEEVRGGGTAMASKSIFVMFRGNRDLTNEADDLIGGKMRYPRALSNVQAVSKG
jgi:hypothetical protein